MCLFLGTSILILAYIASYRWFDCECFIYIVCFGIGISLVAAGEEHIFHDENSLLIRAVEQLPNISYAIYLNHYIVMRGIKYIIPQYHHWIVLVYLVILIVYSICTTKFVKIIENFIMVVYQCMMI